MRKWQIVLSIILGSMFVLLGIGFVMCNYVY